MERGDTALGRRDPGRGGVWPKRATSSAGCRLWICREACAGRRAAVDAGDESGWTPVADGPVFRYVRALREDGAERTIPPDLRLRTLYTVELVCAPGRSVVLVEEGLRGRLADVASKAVESARVSERWRVEPSEPIFVRRMRYDLDEWSDVPVPEGYRVDPFRASAEFSLQRTP